MSARCEISTETIIDLSTMTSFDLAILTLTKVQLGQLETRIISPFLGMLRIVSAFFSAFSYCLVCFINQCLISVLLLVRMYITANRPPINGELVNRVPCSFRHLLLFKCFSRDNPTLVMGHLSNSQSTKLNCSRIMSFIRRLVIRHTIVYFYNFGHRFVLTLGIVTSL